MDYNLLQQKNEEYAMDGGSFEAMRLEFEKTIEEVKEEPMNQELEPFLKEYEKLFRTLLKSHENEKRLFRKAEELQQKIIGMTQSIRSDIKLKKDNLLTKESLDNEVKEVWEKVRNSHLKETKQKDLMLQFRREINILRDLLKHGVNLGASSQQRIEVLESERNTVTEKIQDYDEEISKLIKQVGYQQQHVLEVEKKLHQQRDHERKIANEVEKHKMELERQIRLRHEGEEQLKATRIVIQEKTGQMSDLRVHINRQHSEVMRQQTKRSKDVQKMAQLQQRISTLNERKQRLNIHKDRQDSQNEKLLHQTVHLKEEIDQVFSKISNIERSDADLEKEMERVLLEERQLKEARDDIEHQKQKHMDRISSNQKSLQHLKRDYDRGKSQLEDQTHHKSVLDRMNRTLEKTVETRKSNLTIQSGKKMNLLRKKKAYRNASEIHRKELYLLKKENLRYEQQQTEAIQKERVAMEDIKEHTALSRSYQKNVSSLQDRIKKHTELLAKVTNDRDEYQKQVQDKIEQIQTHSTSLKYLQKMIDQKKEEMKSTDNKIQRKYIEVEHTKNQTEYYKKMVEQKKKLIKMDRERWLVKSEQILKLSKILKDAEEERCHQCHEIESVTNDRDTLSQSLIKRNEQLGKLHQKISLQQNQINLGRRKFQNHSINISALENRTMNLIHNKEELVSKLSILDQLKKENHGIEKQINLLRNQKKSLEMESQKKMNVHRWRKMEGSNPKLFHMIRKVQRLQKNLIRKNNSIQSSNGLIQQKEKLYVDLKKLVLKQPSGEVFDQLNTYRMILKKKTGQVKNLELQIRNANNHLEKKKKFVLKNLEKQFLGIKKDYFKKKRMRYRKPTIEEPNISQYNDDDDDMDIEEENEEISEEENEGENNTDDLE